MIDTETLSQLEKAHAAGLSSAEILDVFARHDVQLSEATLRKYVQLGLLPRSVRVGRKGKHQGSQGIYPVSVVRQVLRIKQMMAESYTIEQIQREFLFIRSEVEQLESMLTRIFKKLDGVLKERKAERVSSAVHIDLLY
jgi:DNA-binding transcriptional MerR regulator